MLHQQAPEIILYCAVGFGTALACAAAATRRTMAFRKAVHWPGVRGKIIKSDAFHCRYFNYCRIRYAFVVGHEITGRTPRLSGNWFWTSIQMDAFVARYPVDQSVEVFYDPENPRRNCLDREDRGGLLPLWVGAALAVICTALLAWGWLTISKGPAFGVAKVGHNYVAELLLANKADANAKNNYRDTPLHLAAMEGNVDLARLLLANKAEVNAKGHDGRAPLRAAASSSEEAVAELLRQHGGHE